MRERPILYSGPMNRALNAGTKTQTRRVIGLSSLRGSTTPGYIWTWRGQAPIRSVTQQARHPRGCWQDVSHAQLLDLCPYGAPGDRLWVREAWGLHRHGDETDWHRGTVRGWSEDGVREQFEIVMRAEWGSNGEACFWRPPMFMPRWASRLTLEVTSVRVERVQSISEADARAEGLSTLTKDGGRLWKWGIPDRDGLPGNDDDGWHWKEWETDPREAFRKLWDSINGKREGCSWSANPWVWVLGFQRVDGGAS